MDTFDQGLCSGPAEIFKALGHPVRFWIAQQLTEEEHCVHEFVERTDLDFSTISQHLNALKQAGIVSGEKRGKQVFYRLDCVCVRDFLRCVTKNMKDGCPNNGRVHPRSSTIVRQQLQNRHGAVPPTERCILSGNQQLSIKGE